MRNFFSPGNPFSGFQEPLLEREPDRLDPAAVYADLTKQMCYNDESGRLMPAGEKDRRELTPPRVAHAIDRFASMAIP